ncbi:MAG: polysaccharide deacetylase family protein [Clostridia bacterium]|nr:polysaccharide deacetylase family protein [Clostridia bacterium]
MKRPWQPHDDSQKEARRARLAHIRAWRFFRASLVIAAAICVIVFLLLGGAEGLLRHEAVSGSPQPGDAAPLAKIAAQPQQRLVPDGRPVVALTFDDGPNDSITPALIKVLNERGVTATFFMLGERIEQYPDVALLAYESGHQIASHTYNHKSPLTRLGEQELAREVNDAIGAIRGVIGEDPAYMRPPFGEINRQTALTVGWPMILWTVDPRDWECQNADQIYDVVMDNIYDGAVVLMHDKYDSTLEAAQRVIDTLIEQDWRFVTIEQYYQLYGIDTLPGHVYRGQTEVMLQ